jgi:hypothetical protein
METTQALIAGLSAVGSFLVISTKIKWQIVAFVFWTVANVLGVGYFYISHQFYLFGLYILFLITSVWAIIRRVR